MTTAAAAVARWRDAGTYVRHDGGQVFAIEFGPKDADGPPVLILHGYPTSSYDWHLVVPALGTRRRVVLCDYPGFGLSDKPDVRYGIDLYADSVERVAAALGLDDVVLVTHDLGDSVGGEVLARDLDGNLRFSISSRVVTNGSIYMDLAQLSADQQSLLAAPDEPVDLAALGIDPGVAFKAGVAGTFAPDHTVGAEEMEAHWLMASHLDGHKLLARTIRYIEDRRANESRYTGAIEKHPSPLTIIWGELDPIAVAPMAARLAEARPDAKLHILNGIGHYPMIEAPDRFGELLNATVLADGGNA